ncbi:MAG: TetR family transcriptional regulator [Acidobacteriota bacterium]
MSQENLRSHQIIDTMLEMLESRGLVQVTTAALARCLGFTEAALYRYFPGKDAIVAAALRQLTEQLLAAMIVELVPELAARSGAAPQLERHVQRFAARRGILLELLLAAVTSHSGELTDAANAFLQEYTQRMGVYFQHLQEKALANESWPASELRSAWVCQLLGGFVGARLTQETWEPLVQEGFVSFIRHALAPAPRPGQ